MTRSVPGFLLIDISELFLAGAYETLEPVLGNLCNELNYEIYFILGWNKFIFQRISVNKLCPSIFFRNSVNFIEF